VDFEQYMTLMDYNNYSFLNFWSHFNLHTGGCHHWFILRL